MRTNLWFGCFFFLLNSHRARCNTGLDEMKAAGVLCRSLQRAVRMESPSVLLGKGGVSGGVSCDFVELWMAPGWSCPPAVVLKTFQCHRVHFWELSRTSFDQKKKKKKASGFLWFIVLFWFWYILDACRRVSVIFLSLLALQSVSSLFRDVDVFFSAFVREESRVVTAKSE